jgi:RecB family exonuclease/transposase-like protein
MASGTHRSSHIVVLSATIAAAQNADPLAPVHVLVPTTLAGLTQRRAVAEDRGLLNVRFGTLAQLAERLTARQYGLTARREPTAAERADAVRAVLQNGAGRLAQAAREHRATAALLGGLFAELEAAEVDTDVRGLSPEAAEVVNLLDGYRARASEHRNSAQVLRDAATEVRAGRADRIAVVVPETVDPTPAENDLLEALDDAGWLTRIHPPAGAPAVASINIAPDAEEEVRQVVRRLVPELRGRRPERVGVAYGSSTPYARIVAEQLSAADVPHHVAQQRTVAQSLAGRTLTRVLELHRREFPRAQTLALFGDAPLRDAEGRLATPHRWQQVTVDAGVSQGRWRTRVDRWVTGQRAKPTEDEETRDRRLSDLETCCATVENLSERCAAVDGSTSWTEVARSLDALLDACFGRTTTWPGGAAAAIDRDCLAVVRRTIRALGHLDATSPPPTPATIRSVLLDELAVPAPGLTTVGRGVLTGSIASFAGTDLDVLFVLGLTEDSVPARVREHPILRDADRELLSPHLATVRSRRTTARRAWDSALGGARQVHLSAPRANTRTQRRTFPSPWLLEEASRLETANVSTRDLETLDRPWLLRADSFVDSLRASASFADLHELDVATAFASGPETLASHDPRFARALAAVRDRTLGTFGSWSGHVGPLPESVTADVRLSASRLQGYATCPARTFFGDVLRVRDLEERNDDTLTSADKGTLLHEVLEEFFTPHLGTAESPGIPPAQAWTTADLERIEAILADVADRFEAEGKSGRHPTVWEVQKAEMRRTLVIALAEDAARRSEFSSWPIALEAAFGLDDAEPLTVVLPRSGSVDFAGCVDRIDRTADGGMLVLDYKTGSSKSYDRIPRRGGRTPEETDLVDRGRKLQLPIYALAARRGSGEDTPTTGYFVFPGGGDHGGSIDADVVERFHAVVDGVVHGIRSGVYPLNPGPYDSWSGYENCRYCAFDRVCPSTRGEQWQHVRDDPAVQEYRDLAEPQGDA